MMSKDKTKNKSKIEKWIIYGVHHPEFIECTEEELKESLRINPSLAEALEKLKKVLKKYEKECYKD